ncbi:MAG: histone H1 [Bacteroidales bacterium]|nr:histone H1 [Bacteroidales bacterium]
MEELVKSIEVLSAEFLKEANAQALKGNKAAGLRARKAALELMKQLKEFRAVSNEAAKA